MSHLSKQEANRRRTLPAVVGAKIVWPLNEFGFYGAGEGAKAGQSLGERRVDE